MDLFLSIYPLPGPSLSIFPSVSLLTRTTKYKIPRPEARIPLLPSLVSIQQSLFSSSALLGGASGQRRCPGGEAELRRIQDHPPFQHPTPQKRGRGRSQICVCLCACAALHTVGGPRTGASWWPRMTSRLIRSSPRDDCCL